MERVDDQRGLMVLRRALPAAVQDSDGLDAGLRELDPAVVLNSRLLRARLLFATERVDDGIAQLKHIIGVLRTWGDRQPTITEMAGIGARALMAAGRDADAAAFWEKHTT